MVRAKERISGKAHLLLVVLLCISFNLQSQSFQWAKQFQCTASIATDIIVDHQQNVISSGWFQDNIDLDPGLGNYDPTPPNQIVTSAYLSKLDGAGNFIWGHYYNTGSNNPQDNVRLLSIDVDANDNILVMGMYRDSINMNFTGSNWLRDPTPNNSDYDNIFIAKYDPSSNYIWSKSWHSTITINGYGLAGHSIKVDQSNNIVMTGRFNNTVDFDPGNGQFNITGPSNTSFFPVGDKFLLKLDSNGNFMWVRNWEDTEDWVFNDAWYGANELDVDLNNNIFLPISFVNTLDVNPEILVNAITSRGQEDIALLKISPAGSLVWHKQIGDTSRDFCNSLATDLNNNIFYTLRTYSSRLDVDPGLAQTLFYWPASKRGNVILKLDRNGDYLWAKKNMSDDSTTSWSGEGIATNSAGDLYLTSKLGQSGGWDLDPGMSSVLVSSAGSDDVAIQNLDSNGLFIWGGAFGGAASDWSYNICTDTGKGVYLAGHFFSTADFDPGPQGALMTSTGLSYDAFVLKLNNCNKATNQLEQHCDSVLFNGNVYLSDTVLRTYYSTYLGCDSTHTVLIDVTKHYDTLTVDTCKFYTWHGNTYTNSGFYTDFYGSVNGCDSASTLDLTIYDDTLINLNIADCDSTVVNGVTYTQTGTYYQNFTTAAGCDSNYLINFTRLLVDTSLYFLPSSNLLANAVNATYQWLDCSTMQIIPGATSSTYTATQFGSYACIITQNGCTDTSGCWNISFEPDGLPRYKIHSKIYPNPSKGTYHLELSKMQKDVQIDIRNVNGQLIWQQHFDQLKETIIDINSASGVYMLYLKHNGGTQVKKLLKW